jgi:type I restriction enzyme R subunit
LGYAIGHGPQIAPGELAAERSSFGDCVLVGRLREAIWRLNRFIQSATLVNLRDTLLPKLHNGELNVADTTNLIQATN